MNEDEDEVDAIADAADGEVADGEVANGEVADGEVVNDEVANGEIADGEIADAEVAETTGMEVENGMLGGRQRKVLKQQARRPVSLKTAVALLRKYYSQKF
jgi:hypothetical protein